MRIFFTILSVSLFSFLTSCSPPSKVSDTKEEFEGMIVFENSIISSDLTENERDYYNLFGDHEIMSMAAGNYLNEYPNGQSFTKRLYRYLG